MDHITDIEKPIAGNPTNAHFAGPYRALNNKIIVAKLLISSTFLLSKSFKSNKPIKEPTVSMAQK